MKALKIGGWCLLAVAVYAAGFLPEHRKYLQASDALRAADAELSDTRGKLRVALMKRSLREAVWRVESRDFSAAETTLEQFFTDLRIEIARPDMGKFRDSLQKVLEKQDSLMQQLRGRDPRLLESIRSLQAETDLIMQPPSSANLPPVLTRIPKSEE